jgi:hypothetical protein
MHFQAPKLPVLLAALLLAGAAGSVSAQAYVAAPAYPPAPAYQYVYYPAQQVYYAPARHHWYWAVGSSWQTGPVLPGYLNVDVNLGGVPVVLGSPLPYYQHAYVERVYGAPWRVGHGWHGGYGYYHPYYHHHEHWHEHGHWHR